ncbi:hypothetical protein BJY00DRAFT_108879 [Aspergillus carlsbadensis]|nr:hypothetical protein BJY00DRAFT_108879 [Aspergillus carlsbadensis]
MAIAQKAAQCAVSLEGMVQAGPTEEARQEWENQIFRFNLWSANNFVFAPIRASMDWRLRNAPLLESSMCELLDDLQSTLIRQTAVMRNPNIQSQTHLDNPVNDTLEELFRLSRAVRRSGILRRFVKIESYIEFDETGVNLTDEFRKGVERLLVFRLKDSTASQELRERVVNTICLRQQHFAYLRAKWDKGTRPSKPPNPAVAQPRSSLGATFSVKGSMASSPRPAKDKERVSIPTVMTATTARPERMKQVRSLKSAVSAEHADIECDQGDLPPPPRVPPGAVEHECPFCYMVCSASEFSGERWKNHVVQDIMPYFCIFDDCPTTNTLFESGRDWLKHMRDRHVVTGWTCMDETHNTIMVFNSDAEFRDHMQTCHNGAFADDELDDIVIASYQRLPVDTTLTNCPFCPTNVDANVPTDKIMNHIADHMLSFAQISISWQLGDENSDSASSHAGASSDDTESFRRGYRAEPNGRRMGTRVRSKYWWSAESGSSLPARWEGELPALDGGHPEIDDESRLEDETLPHGDWEFFDSLWKAVRQALHLPSLHSGPPSSPYGLQGQGQTPHDAESIYDQLSESDLREDEYEERKEGVDELDDFWEMGGPPGALHGSQEGQTPHGAESIYGRGGRLDLRQDQCEPRGEDLKDRTDAGELSDPVEYRRVAPAGTGRGNKKYVPRLRFLDAPRSRARMQESPPRPRQSMRYLWPQEAGPGTHKVREQPEILFVCSFHEYGCRFTSASKNGWKIHVNSEHIQQGFYRCDTGWCGSAEPTQEGIAQGDMVLQDFYRKDRFIEHHRRNHAPWAASEGPRGQRLIESLTVPLEETLAFETTISEAVKRCWHRVRQPPTRSMCGFCGQEFSGDGSWKERMEHVAGHFERGDDPWRQQEDLALREWAADQGVIVLRDGEWWLKSLVGEK